MRSGGMKKRMAIVIDRKATQSRQVTDSISSIFSEPTVANMVGAGRSFTVIVDRGGDQTSLVSSVLLGTVVTSRVDSLPD